MKELATNQIVLKKKKKNSFTYLLKEDFKKHKSIYFMILPVVLYYIIFHYGPMGGIIIAFKDYRPGRGIIGSEWVGLKHFIDFLTSYNFWRLFKNTLVINFSTLIWGFPAPIILALLLNELRIEKFKKTVQTITYMPHFISIVVIAGIIKQLVAYDGIFNDLIVFFGGERFNLLNRSELFVPIYVISEIWQHVGWSTIIYLAALSGISPDLYEAAEIDGANRWQKLWAVTIPGIAPTISILLIMRIGRMMTLGWEKIVLLYNPAIYETADVISTFVYRKGILEADFSYSAAVGVFNSVINLSLLLIANKAGKKLNGTGLW